MQMLLTDPDFIIMLAQALKGEREARKAAEMRSQLLLKEWSNVPRCEVSLYDQVAQKTVNKNEMSLPEQIPNQTNLSVIQIAELLNISTKTVYRRIAAGELPVQRLSANCLRVEMADLEAYKNGLKQRTPYTRKTVDSGGTEKNR